MSDSSEKRSFNLITEPWIPIAGFGEVSLWDVFTHPEYRRLGGTPVETVVLMRLLLAIVHASNTIKTTADWQSLTPALLAANARSYLEKWRDRFDLFDETYPFLQFPQLKGKCKEVSIGSLAFPVASGNKTALTQWSINERFSVSETARLLLCASGYGLGGGKYDLFAKIDPNGPEKRKKPTGKASAPQGPLVGYKGFLHSCMLGETLLESVHLNLLTEEILLKLKLFSDSDPMGRPFWESRLTDESGESAKKYVSGYQGILFPLDKIFCLDGEKLLMTQGITYPSHKNGQWDPGITLFSEKKDVKALWCDVEKKPWRQLASLLKFFDVDENTTMPAFLVWGCARLNLAEDSMKSFGIWTGGISVSSNSGEYYVSGKNDFISSEFLIPLDWVASGATDYLLFKSFMSMLSDYALAVYGSVFRYFNDFKDDRKDDLAAAATRLFWEKMEPHAQEVIDLTVEKDPEVVEAHKKAWQRIGTSCYEQLCPSISPRQIQIFVKNMPNFKPKKKNGGKAAGSTDKTANAADSLESRKGCAKDEADREVTSTVSEFEMLVEKETKSEQQFKKRKPYEGE